MSIVDFHTVVFDWTFLARCSHLFHHKLLTIKKHLNVTVVIGHSGLLCGYHVNPVPLNALCVHLCASMLVECHHFPIIRSMIETDFHLFSMG